MESNLDTKTPKLNAQNVSSAVFGKDGGSNGSMKNIHGTISKLAGHVRKAVIRIGALEKKLFTVEKRLTISEEKTTKIINILKTQKSNVGKKIPATGGQNNLEKELAEVNKTPVKVQKELGKKIPATGGQNNLEKELAEVNKTLVEVQKELQKYFSFQAKTDKEEKEKASRDESRKRLKAEESQLKKSSKNLGSQVKKRSEEIVKPTRGIFDSIMDFVGTLALGIGANAIFEWLKDEENQKKVQGWFTWIKDHWQWVAGALGIMLALPLVGAITGIVGVIGSLASVLKLVVGPLLALLTNPIFLGVAASAGLLFGMKAAVDAGKRYGAGGQAHLDAFNALKAELNEAGITVKGSGKKETFALATNRRGRTTKTLSSHGTDEQKALVESYKRRRDALIDNKNAMKAEISKQRDAVNPVMIEGKTSQRERMRGGGATKMVEDGQATEKLRNEAESKVRVQFEGNIPGIIEARAKGGPVTRNESYLVGEKGPELFVPNINGSIVNNHRTEKIYQMITSKRRGRGGVNISTLPMQTHELPPPEIKMGTSGMPSTDVPDIPSVNMADPYRSVVSRNILGITV